MKARDESIYGVHLTYSCTLKEIADFIKIHYSTVSKIVRKERQEEREERERKTMEG